MLDATQRKELVEVLEEVYEVSSTSKAIISGSKATVKKAKTMMKDWAERNEVSPESVQKVYKEYEAYREGKIEWDGENAADDEFVELLIAVQDQVIEESK